MTTRAFYEARADECGRDAAGSDLANVKERLLRSQAAWQGMAERLQRTETMRNAREAQKPDDWGLGATAMGATAALD